MVCAVIFLRHILCGIVITCYRFFCGGVGLAALKGLEKKKKKNEMPTKKKKKKKKT
jgi:hypothetical protein